MKTRAALLVMLIASAAGCSSAYYGALEAIGIPKRRVLINRVEAAEESQREAKEQFISASERFRQLIRFEGGELESRYHALDRELQAAEAKAEAVHQRIDAVESVAEALFDEWKAELKQYSNSSLRAGSEEKLRQTKERYSELMKAMRRAESRLEPALAPLRDNVLFLKHNLNARALASLSDEARTVDVNVERLVRELEQSIDESREFISRLRE